MPFCNGFFARFSFVALIAFIALSLTKPVSGHEFWIEPEDYTLQESAAMTAHLRVGQKFKGSELIYNPRNFRRFELVVEDQTYPIPGRPGDRPALTMEVPDTGLGVVVYETSDLHLTYQDFGKFEAFLKHKDWVSLSAVHRQRGLPEKGFRERYVRYAKSLVALGDKGGADRPVGLETEIVALANPYVDDLAVMPVRVLYQGQPRLDSQVELFAKAPDGMVTVTLHRTDGQGKVDLPVKQGYSYLVDAVVIRAIEPEQDRDPVWMSLWASLTFAVP